MQARMVIAHILASQAMKLMFHKPASHTCDFDDRAFAMAPWQQSRSAMEFDDSLVCRASAQELDNCGVHINVLSRASGESIVQHYNPRCVTSIS